MTEAETFVWHTVSSRLRLGLAYLHKQGAFRGLASYQLSPETEKMPSLNASVGVQGIGTGNPGYSLTGEKNFGVGVGRFNVFAGVGYRANEDHLHLISGAKVDVAEGLSVGIQLDGHQHNPFIVYGKGHFLGGLYLIDGKRLAYLGGVRF